MDLYWLQVLYFPILKQFLFLGAMSFAFTRCYRLMGMRKGLPVWPNQVVWSKNKSVQLAQLKIYVLSFFVVGVLFWTFSTLNFWSGKFHFPTSPAVQGGRTMLAYLFQSISLVLPIFFCLQVALKQKIESETFRACLFTAQPFLHLLIFITTVFLTIPWLEALKAVLDQSILVPEGVAFFLSMAAHISMLSGLSLFALNTLKSPSVRYSFAGTNYQDLIRQQKFLESSDFSTGMLENKTDSEITFLIKLANYAGDTEQANLISQYLLARHTTQIEPQRQTLS